MGSCYIAQGAPLSDDLEGWDGGGGRGEGEVHEQGGICIHVADSLP